MHAGMSLEDQIKALKPLRVFIGFDDREQDAYDVCKHSLCKHSSIPLVIQPLVQSELRAAGLYTRPLDEPASTQFAHTRFLVPHLSDYEGYSLFVDCDFLFTRDIAELWRHCDRDAAVNVVKHDYTPRAKWKMDGQPQVAYPRKNWSSLMVFNNEKFGLTPLDVNEMTPQSMHQFQWLDDEQIHSLPQSFNWLEGEGYPVDEHELPAAIHFTNGMPLHGCRPMYGNLWEKTLSEVRA